jgi:hypothetical protein
MRELLTMLILIAGAAAPVAAGRAPTEQERAAIEAFLRREGYVSWEKIKLDKTLWEDEGTGVEEEPEYEINLERETLRIMKVDRRFIATVPAERPRTTHPVSKFPQ